MPTDRRRAAARRRAWGRGPIILRFEPLEGRQLLSSTAGSATPAAAPDLVGAAFDTLHNLAWGDTFHAKGAVLNQGDAPVTTAFKVEFYASPTPALSSATAVPLGEATVPAGLQPGQRAPIDQILSMPDVPMAGVGADNTVYVEMVIDPQNVVAESDKQNNAGRGEGYDLSMVTITAHQPASLSGSSLGVYPDQATWGSTVQVTASVQNSGPGDAPPTRARVVLTPAGIAPGSGADVTIGSLSVPAIPANQTAVVTQNITLPAVPPSTLVGSTGFTLSVSQDADFVVNPVAPHNATGGLGLDMVNLAIAQPADPNASLGPKPDLTPVNVQAPSLPISSGQTFQVTTTIQNVGNLDAGPYRVRFYLVGANGDLSTGYFLGDAQLNGLKAGYGQQVIQTLKFPGQLPNGLTMNSQAKIAVEVDPENAIDEQSKANNIAVSDVVTLNIINADGTSTPVANTPAAALTATTPPTKATTPTNLKPTGTTPTPTPAPKVAAAAKKKPAPKVKHTLQHNLKVFPKHVSSSVKKFLKKL